MHVHAVAVVAVVELGWNTREAGLHRKEDE